MRNQEVVTNLPLINLPLEKSREEQKPKRVGLLRTITNILRSMKVRFASWEEDVLKRVAKSYDVKGLGSLYG